MLSSNCATDSSYVRISNSCLLKLSKDATKPPNTEAMLPTMRFTVLRRAKVDHLSTQITRQACAWTT